MFRASGRDFFFFFGELQNVLSCPSRLPHAQICAYYLTGIAVRHEPHRTLLTFFEYVGTVNAAFLKLAQRLLSRIERICIYLKLENFQLPCSCTFLHVHWRDCRDSLTALALLLTGNNPMFSVWKVPISNFLIVVCIASAPVFKKDELSFSLFCAHIAWEIKKLTTQMKDSIDMSGCGTKPVRF